MISFSIGVVSKNTVDTCIEFCKENFNIHLVLIPSRRQVDFCGGYVEDWTTNKLMEYLQEKSSLIKVQRDHGGPSQGFHEDNGYESLLDDCKHLHSIHIDPWKFCNKFEDGIVWTERMIRCCYEKNPDIEYEVGTEEGIRPFSVEEVRYFLTELKTRLPQQMFRKIKFAVVQCGTGLKEGVNIGSFDENRLTRMVSAVRTFGIEPKEHNGDWIDISIIRRKQALGLSHMNIAPEFGAIETQVVWNELNDGDREKVFTMCLHSDRWQKWVSKEFDPYQNKEQLVHISGHYIFSKEEFKNILKNYVDIQTKIKYALKKKLCELFFE